MLTCAPPLGSCLATEAARRADNNDMIATNENFKLYIETASRERRREDRVGVRRWRRHD